MQVEVDRIDMPGVAHGLAEDAGEIAARGLELCDLETRSHPREGENLLGLAVHVTLAIPVRPGRIVHRSLDVLGNSSARARRPCPTGHAAQRERRAHRDCTSHSLSLSW